MRILSVLSVFSMCSASIALSSQEATRASETSSVEQLAEAIFQYHANDERIAKRCSAYAHRPLFLEKKKFALLGRMTESIATSALSACTPSDIANIQVHYVMALDVQACLDRHNLCGYGEQQYEKCVDPLKAQAAIDALKSVSKSCEEYLSEISRDEL